MSPRFTSLDEHQPTDVLVLGSGPAGLSAAISAARAGANSVRIVDRFGFVGGNMTAGLVGPCMTSFSLDGMTQLVRGLFDEFVRRMEASGGAVHPSETLGGTAYSGYMRYGHDRVTPFDPEAAKSIGLEMLREAGVELLLHTFVADAMVTGRRVDGVVIANKSGLGVLEAQTVIDCTGDGDVAAWAGAPYEYGRDEDGKVQPMTLFFRIAGVDDEAVDTYRAQHPEDHFPYQSIVEEARRAGKFPVPRNGVQLFKTGTSGVWRINTTRALGMDGRSAKDLTAAELETRDQVKFLIEFFRENLPGLESCWLMDTAATIGVRESRRIIGDYKLTLDDLVSGRPFDDVIATAGYPVDIHSPTNGSGPFEDDMPITANIYEIPYSTMLPQGLDNLIVAGRCLSASHEALAAVRVMPPCFAMGEAAGIASVMANERGSNFRSVDIGVLQRRLVEQGAYLGARFAVDADVALL